MRVFMIQHDCGHGAFFRHRLANDWVGRAIGVLTLTPYDAWRRAHAMHHAGAGNRSEEHTSELQSLMRISYDVFCLNKKKHTYKPSKAHSNCHTRAAQRRPRN